MQHVAGEGLRLGAVDPAGEGVGEDAGGVGGRHQGGVRSRVTVVAGERAGADEGLAPATERLDERVVVGDVEVGELAEPGQVLLPAGRVDVHQCVGTEGRDDPVAQTRVAQRLVVGEVVDGRVGGREQLDVEAVEQSARPEAGLRQLLGDAVVDRVRALGRGLHVDAEDLDQLVLEPVAAGSGAEQVPLAAEPAPDDPGVGLAGAAVAARDAEVLQRDPLRGEHPGDVVVGHHEELGRVGVRRVGDQVRGIDVAVHADEGQVAGRGEDLPGDDPHRRLAGQRAIRAQVERLHVATSCV